MTASVRLATPRLATPRLATSRSGAPGLFGTGSMLVLLLGNAIGGVCIAVNWWRAGDSGDLEANLSAADVAVVGIVIAVVANGLWYLTARGAITRRRRLLSSRVSTWGAALEASDATREHSTRDAATEIFPPGSQSSPEMLRFVAVPGGSLYHRSDCLLVARKQTLAAPHNPGEGEPLQPCGVCEPHLITAQIGTEALA